MSQTSCPAEPATSPPSLRFLSFGFPSSHSSLRWAIWQWPGGCSTSLSIATLILELFSARFADAVRKSGIKV